MTPNEPLKADTTQKPSALSPPPKKTGARPTRVQAYRASAASCFSRSASDCAFRIFSSLAARAGPVSWLTPPAVGTSVDGGGTAAVGPSPSTTIRGRRQARVGAAASRRRPRGAVDGRPAAKKPDRRAPPRAAEGGGVRNAAAGTAAAAARGFGAPRIMAGRGRTRGPGGKSRGPQVQGIKGRRA